MPGLPYGPEPKSPYLIRINKGKPDQRIQKKIKRERARRSRRDRKKLLREERLRTKIVLREWLLEWSSDGLPAVPTVKKFKKDLTAAQHGTEEVTAEVRRMLGKSFKPKMKTKNSQKADQEKRDQAEQMRRRHKEQESSKYRPGSREAAHKDRPRRVKQRKEGKKKVQTVGESKGQEESMGQEEFKGQKKSQGQEESQGQQESQGQEESKGQKEAKDQEESKGEKESQDQEEFKGQEELRRGQVPPCKKRILLALPVWSA